MNLFRKGCSYILGKQSYAIGQSAYYAFMSPRGIKGFARIGNIPGFAGECLLFPTIYK